MNKIVIYGDQGEWDFGTIYGIGEDYDTAHAEAVQNLCGLEEEVDVHFFTIEATEGAYEELLSKGGNDIHDERFVLCGDVLKLLEEVTARDLESAGGFVDLRPGSWLTTPEWQLQQVAGATMESMGWSGLAEDAVIVMHDDGAWEEV